MKTDKQVGIECYSVFNHLQHLTDSHIPELDYEIVIQMPENSFQLHTVIFLHNLRLAALENNLANLLTNCYLESEDFEQFKRLTPFLCSESHLLCVSNLIPFHQVDEVKVLDFFMRFVANFSMEVNIAEFIQFKVIPFMHNFKLRNEKQTHSFPKHRRSESQLLH